MKTCIFRKFAALLLCILCIVSVVGCDGKGALVGAWELTAAAVDGESVDISEIGFAEIALEADGTAKLITNEASAESTWSYNNGKLIIDDMTCEYDDGIITVNQYGMYLKFTKK